MGWYLISEAFADGACFSSKQAEIPGSRVSGCLLGGQRRISESMPEYPDHPFLFHLSGRPRHCGESPIKNPSDSNWLKVLEICFPGLLQSKHRGFRRSQDSNKIRQKKGRQKRMVISTLSAGKWISNIFALFFPLCSHVANPSPRGDALPVRAFALFMGNGSSGSFSPLFAEDCHFETTNSFIWPFSHLNNEINWYGGDTSTDEQSMHQEFNFKWIDICQNQKAPPCNSPT